jgi:hypothetical protein
VSRSRSRLAWQPSSACWARQQAARLHLPMQLALPVLLRGNLTGSPSLQLALDARPLPDLAVPPALHSSSSRTPRMFRRGLRSNR